MHVVLLAQLVTEYVADLSDLMAGATRAQEIVDRFGGLTSGPTKLSQSFDHVGVQANQMAMHINQAQSRVGVLGQHAVTASTQSQRLGSSLASTANHANLFSNALSSARSKVGGFQSSLSSLGGRLLDTGSKLSMIGMGLVGLVSTAFSAGQSLLQPIFGAEQLGIALTNLLGSADAASAEIKKLNKFADETAFEPDQVQQYAAQLIGMKIGADQTIPIMTALGDALYSVGHGSADEMKTMVDLVGKISIAGKATGEDITQMADHGVDGLGAMSLASGLTRDALRDMASNGGIKAANAIDWLTRGIEMNPLYQGGMAKQAQSAAGIFSTLSGYVKTALNNFLGLKDGMIITGGIFDRFKGVLAQVSIAVQSPAFQEFASTMGERVGGAIDRASGFLRTMVVAFQNLNTWVGNFTGTGNMLIPVLAGLGAVLAVILVPAVWSLAAGVIAATWPFLLIGAAVAGLTAIFMHFYNSNAGFRDFINGIGAAIQNAWAIVSANFIPTMQMLGGILAQIGAFLLATFKPAWDQIVTTWQTQLVPAWNQLMAALEPAMPLFQLIGGVILGVVVVALGVFLSTVVGLVQGVAGALPGIIQAFGGVVQFISGAIQVVTGIFTFFVHLTTGQFDKLGGDLGTIWSGIASMFTGIWNVIAGIFNAAIGLVTGYVSGFISTIIGFFTNLYNQLVGHSIIPDMINGIINWFWKLISDPVNAVISMKDRVIGVVGELASRALELGGNIVKNVASGIMGSFQWVKNAVGTVTQWIADHLPHSPARLGPLRDLVYQGEQIVEQISQGMMGGLPQLESAIGNMTKPISLGLTAAPIQTSAKSGRSSSSQPIIVRVEVINDQPVYVGNEKVSDVVMRRVLKETRKGGPIR